MTLICSMKRTIGTRLESTSRADTRAITMSGRLTNQKRNQLGRITHFSIKMGGQTAFGFYDPDAKLVSYYFMGDSAMNDIKTLLREPYNVLWDCAQPLMSGNCLLSEFKSTEFQDENDLVGAVMILPGSFVVYDAETIVIYRRR